MADVAKLTKKRLGDILREQGLINEEHIQEALDRQEETGELMGRALIELDYVTEDDIARVLCTQFGLPYVDVEQCMPDEELIKQIPSSFIKKYSFLPLDRIGDVVVIAVSGVFDQEFFDQLHEITDREIQIVISTRNKIKQSLIDELGLHPDDFDIDETDTHIEREPEEKELDEAESEVIADLAQETDVASKPVSDSSTSFSPDEEEPEKTKTFTLDENEDGEPVIDLESEAERIFEETEQELKQEETQSRPEGNGAPEPDPDDTSEDENEDEQEEDPESSKTEQQASVSS